MSEDRVAFTFQNQRDYDIEVVIEPWALVETVPAGGTVAFQVNATPPAEIEFSVTQAGQQYIYVMSEHVVISIDGEAKHEFQTATRPPMDAFRVMNRLLWGKSDGDA